MSTNGVSHEKYHLLYESTSSEEEELGSHNQPINDRSALSKRNLPSETETPVQQTNGIKKKSASSSFPVISNDRPYNNDVITIATKNGIVEMPKGSIPLSLVRSRSSGKFTETSMLADKGVAIATSKFDELEAIGDGQEGESFVVKKLTSSDTLQGVALLYHTTRAEIKRINNLISDQDFYALKYIKVPATKHSVLFETHSTVPTSPNGVGDGKKSYNDAAKGESVGAKSTASNDETSPSGASHASFDFNSNSINSDPRLDPAKWLESRTVSINQAMSISAELLQSDLSDVCSQAFSRASSVQIVQTSRQRKASEVGADWGISWQHALCCMFFICVALPLLYLLYSRMYPSDGSQDSLDANAITRTVSPTLQT